MSEHRHLHQSQMKIHPTFDTISDSVTSSIQLLTMAHIKRVMSTGGLALLTMALMNIYNIYKVVPGVIESLAKLVCHPKNAWVHGRYIELVMDMAVVKQLEKTPVTTFYSMSLIKDVGDPS